MKKKGFTLVELLGAIVIMAIITSLAFVGYRKISKNVKEKSHENLVSLIEAKAGEYANDTGNLLTNVDNLVKLGYIEADDEEGNVKSPIDGSILNCHIVSIIKDNNSLYGEYSEEEECDLGSLVIKNQNLGINVYETSDNVSKGNKLEENAWTNKNVILEAYVGEKINAENIKKITWKSNVGQESKEVNGDFYSKNEYLVTAEQIVNTSYTVTIEAQDGTIYQAQTEVKIDKQRPVLFEIFIEKENEYTSHDKKVTVTASDGNGSGIYGYYVGENPNCNEVVYEQNGNSSYETYKENGTYYICVKDNAGNTSEDVSTRTIEIKLVDKTLPTCIWNGESAAWTRSDRTISLSCQDSDSGCTLQNSISKTYNQSTKTDYWEYTISDTAGNETVCKKNVNVYVDKCDQTRADYGSWSSCSKKCGGGRKSRTITYVSTFGSGFVCGTSSDSKSCNKKSCSSSSGGSSSGEPCDNPHLVWCCSGSLDCKDLCTAC